MARHPDSIVQQVAHPASPAIRRRWALTPALNIANRAVGSLHPAWRIGAFSVRYSGRAGGGGGAADLGGGIGYGLHLGIRERPLLATAVDTQRSIVSGQNRRLYRHRNHMTQLRSVPRKLGKNRDFSTPSGQASSPRTARSSMIAFHADASWTWNSVEYGFTHLSPRFEG